MNSWWCIYRIPILLWTWSVMGIVLALAGDGHRDPAGWLGLALPLGLCAWLIVRQVRR